MKMRVAVVGVGYLGNFHAQKCKELSQLAFRDQIEFVGVYDANLTQGKKVAESLGVRAFLSLQEMIGLVDLVSVATATSSHFEVAQFFLSNSVHVNVEKPMTVTSAEAQVLISMARSKNLVLCVGHSERFNSAYQQMKTQVRDLRHMDLQRHASYKSRGADVSVVHDLMIHDIDLALSLDASPCEITRARGGMLISKTLDWCNCELRFASGVTASIFVSRMAPQMTRVFKVIEKNRCHEVNFQTGDWSLMTSNPNEIGLLVETKNCGKSDNLMLETEAFFKAVLGLQKPLITGEDGLRALQIVESVVQTSLADFLTGF